MANNKIFFRIHRYPILQIFLIIILFIFSSFADANSYVVNDDQIRSLNRALADGITFKNTTKEFDRFTMVLIGGNCEIPVSSISGNISSKGGKSMSIPKDRWHTIQNAGKFTIYNDGFFKDLSYYEMTYTISCGPGTHVDPRWQLTYRMGGHDNLDTEYPIKGLQDRAEVVEMANLTALNVRPEQCLYIPLFIQKPDNVIVRVRRAPYIKDGIIDVRITGTDWQDMSTATKIKVCGIKPGRGEESMILQMQYR